MNSKKLLAAYPMRPFDPPYDKRWFLPIIVCLMVIIIAGFMIALFSTEPPTLLEAAWEEPQPTPLIVIFGIILSLSSLSVLTVFTVLSIKPPNIDPISDVLIWIVVIVPAIIFPIAVLILMLTLTPH